MALSPTSSAIGAVGAPAQAQQVARQRQRAGNSTAEVRRVLDLIEIHVNGLEEGQESQSPAQLRINDEMPEEEKPQGQKKEKKKKGQNKPPPPPPEAPEIEAVNASNATATPRPLPPKKSAGKPTANSPLYRHLDVKA